MSMVVKSHSEELNLKKHQFIIKNKDGTSSLVEHTCTPPLYDVGDEISYEDNQGKVTEDIIIGYNIMSEYIEPDIRTIIEYQTLMGDVVSEDDIFQIEEEDVDDGV